MKLKEKNNSLIYIIIVNWNGWKDTIECINSIKQLAYTNYRIIIIDNYSTDESLKQLSVLKSDIKLMELEKNMGFAGANNLGIQYAVKNKAEYILLLNNDTIISSGLLTEFVNIMNKYPNAGALAAKVYYYDNPKKIWFAGGKIRKESEFPIHLGFDETDTGQFNTIVDTPFINGSAFFIRADIIKKVGLLDERYFYMYEDADWTTRILNAGYKCLFVPKAIIWHKVHRSTNGRSALWWYYDARNSLLWSKKFFPKKTTFTIILPIITSLFEDYIHIIVIQPPKLWIENWKKVTVNWIAKLYGIIDYFRGQIGECPDFINKLNC
jgi:GT2 family glycosyltransferase